MEDTTQHYSDKCPKCGQDYPWHPDFDKWCGKCGWNLKPEASPFKQSFLKRLYENKGKREGEKMLSSFKSLSEAELKPTLTLSTLVAMFVSFLVHFLSLIIAALGLYVIYTWWPSFMFMVLGILLLAGAWALRPRFGQEPTDYLEEENFPALFSLINRVSKAVGGKMVDYVVVDEDFNASYSQIGIGGKTVMHIGLPLWTVLSMQERVAIIGHEAAHGVNGDPARGIVTGSAVSTLSKWIYFLRPDMAEADGMVTVFMYGILWLISVPVEWLAAGLDLLNLRQSQKAEYLADYLATKAAGTQAMISGLFKLNYYPLLERVLICDIVSDTQPGTDFYKSLKTRLAALPDFEKERMRRLTVLENATLDATHPPTAYRMNFLESRSIGTPKVSLNQDEIAHLENEMKQLEGPTGRRIILNSMDTY